MTPREIRDRLAELREAGVKLRRRPAREVHAALARVLDLFASSESKWRRRLEDELPGATGFTIENVREGLARGLAPFRGEAFLSLVRAELGDPDRLDAAQGTLVSGFETTAVVLAGSIPQPSLLALLAPLALRSPVLAKAASRDPVTAPLLAEAIAEVDPELGRCIAIARFGSQDQACLSALLEADCVAATGSDASIAALAALVQPPRRQVFSGHRLSVTALGPEAMRADLLGEVAEAAALDVALWDQQGCLSPLAVYAVGADREAPDRLADALANALASLERRLPRGAQDTAGAAAFRHECDGAELRAAAEPAVRLLGGPTQRWAVVREADAAPRRAPLNRFVRVHPVENPEMLLAALRPYAAHLAGVALAGFGAARDAVVRGLADLGASRLCRPGELQSPPLAWHHDGRPVLVPLARFTDREDPLWDSGL
jgi:Acyl-CoA reductase (LuxC)